MVTTVARQLEMFPDTPLSECPDYLSTQLITYLGNKRSLLGHIGVPLNRVKQRLGKPRLRIFDVFSGSGVVSRYFKSHASHIVSNDLEDYAAVISRCYLRNRSTVDFGVLAGIVNVLNIVVDDAPLTKGFIEQLYAPADEHDIKDTDRVFYTPLNAHRLDNYRRMIDEYPKRYRDLLLGPLLSEASVHANTAGIFKAFYRNKQTGIGQYGGTGLHALQRIKGQIQLAVPVLSKFECSSEVLQADANEIASEVKGIDLAYVDPPYNEHAYGSNYFMLNLLANYKEPSDISKMSGIPKYWNRSGYNVKSGSLDLLMDLLAKLDAKFLLVSFSNDGFNEPSELYKQFKKIGGVEQYDVCYNTYRGGRNIKDRHRYLTEQMFLIQKR